MLPNVGWPELIFILAIALLVFGPQKMAGIGSALGRAIREFRRSVEAPDEPERPDERRSEDVPPEGARRDDAPAEDAPRAGAPADNTPPDP